VDLTGRTAIVTGAGSGIGQATAWELAKAGASVLVNDVVEDRAQAAAAALRQAGLRAIAYSGSVSDRPSVQGMVNAALDAFGSIDILVNNAGIARNRSILKLSDAEWEAVLKVNLYSVFLCSQLAVPHMIERSWGRIVNIASRSWLGWYAWGNYAASKAGIIGLSRTMALEFARYNITVNVIAPGIIETPMSMGGNPPEVIEQLRRAQPTGEFGKPEDVAWAVHFLASDDAWYITGQTLYVCGGKSLFGTPEE
jgi:2-[hydroxy(phenyl)methyl]-succinyl-CoA dehydrogenase BbsD subunit